MRPIALTALFLFAAACGTGDGDAPVADADSVAAAAPDLDSTTTQPPPVSSDTAWVVRLDGMGPLRVGMTFDEARAALGDLRMNDDNPEHPEGPDRCDYPRSARLPAGAMVMVQGQRVVR